MKKVILAGLIIMSSVFLVTGGMVKAHMGATEVGSSEAGVSKEGDHGESVETVLQDILRSQKVSKIEDLDLGKVSDAEWERLGDAVMALHHPGQEHEMMDKMMGGEGSESLRQMHMRMGKVYLGYYGKNDQSEEMMMGRGMMENEGRGFVGAMGMMGTKIYGVLGVITWITTLTFMTTGTYFFVKKAGGRGK